MKLNVAVIGMGVGFGHAQGFQADPRVGKLVFCDVSEEKLKQRAAELGVEETTTDWTSLIGREDIQLVSVAAPDHLHPEMAVAFLEDGKHVLCEKPMAPTLPEARRIVAAVEKSGKKLLVNNILRFLPRFQRVKKLVEDGELGRIYAAEGDYLHNTLTLIRDGWRGKFRHSVSTGGGVHLIDLLLWIVGEIEEACCFGSRAILSEEECPYPECLLAILRFKDGCVGKSMTNMALQKPALHNLILYGTKGVFINGKPDGMLYRGVDEEKAEPVTDAYVGVGRPKGIAISHLLDCIERDEEPLVNAREGARAIAVCDAINRSYENGGKPEKVEEV